MRFTDWLLGRDPQYRALGLANPSTETFESFGVSPTFSGERVTVKAALELATVRSAVAMISQAVGGLPLKVYRILDDDERVEARSHRSWRMLHDKPNPFVTARNFWAATAAQLLIYENSFVFKERDLNGEVESLFHLDPAMVRVEVEGRTKRYIVEGPPRKVYTDDDVVHIVGFSADGYYGSSRITQAKQTLGTAVARARFEGEFYAQGAYFPGLIEYPGRLGEQGTKNLAAAMQARHGGAGNRHKTPVLEEGSTWKQAGMTLADMQFAELSEQTRTDIAVLFNLPPAFLGGTTGDSLTYATTESNWIQFAQMAVWPIADTIAKALTLDPSVLPWNVMFAEFVLEGLLRADMKTRAEYWEKLKGMGAVDAEYIAARENLPKPKPEPEPEPVPSDAEPILGEPMNGRAPIPLRSRT